MSISVGAETLARYRLNLNFPADDRTIIVNGERREVLTDDRMTIVNSDSHEIPADNRMIIVNGNRQEIEWLCNELSEWVGIQAMPWREL
ncbi:MAG: hypothetical protein KME47_23900 [Nodosilinea sp. WJT8-NPBG4]|jgi:hypothetical protein|nr:hypothetical protein [Nodosilinea sp. WJT8-NPBG4]